MLSYGQLNEVRLQPVIIIIINIIVFNKANISTQIINQQPAAPRAVPLVAPVVNRVVADPKPNDYMVFSILNFLFFCWILGLVALVYSFRVSHSL